MARLSSARLGIAAAVLLWTTSSFAQGMGPLDPPLVSPLLGDPKEAWKEKEDPLRGKGLTACQIGDRVTVSYQGQWVPGQVIAVDPAASYPCKVHMIGRPPATDTSFAAWMLRAPSR
jgi:hypothetical protein